MSLDSSCPAGQSTVSALNSTGFITGFAGADAAAAGAWPVDSTIARDDGSGDAPTPASETAVLLGSMPAGAVITNPTSSPEAYSASPAQYVSTSRPQSSSICSHHTSVRRRRDVHPHHKQGRGRRAIRTPSHATTLAALLCVMNFTQRHSGARASAAPCARGAQARSERLCSKWTQG